MSQQQLVESPSVCRSQVHDERVEEQRARHTRFVEKTCQMQSYLDNLQSYQVITSVNSVESMTKCYKLVSDDHYQCTNVGQSNVAGFSRLVKATAHSDSTCLVVLCRVVNAAAVSGSVALRLGTSFAIAKYMGVGRKANQFLTIHDIFCVNCHTYYIFHDRYLTHSALIHHLHNSEGTLTTATVKAVVTKLAETVEYLNIHGIAHRFIRAENVLVVVARDSCTNKPTDQVVSVKLTAFDMCCLFWDANESRSIACSKALPIAVPPTLLDHLPPEAFESEYDASMVDVWSIATVAIHMLAGENPFRVDTIDRNGANRQQSVCLSQWNCFTPKLWIADEVRSLLDDIFVEANVRMTVTDLMRDKRLDPSLSSETFIRTKLTQYYRIDTAKNLNLTKPEPLSSASQLCTSVPISEEEFSPNSAKVIQVSAYKSVASEDAITEFRILRDQSFEADPTNLGHDCYLKVARTDVDDLDTDPTEPLSGRSLLLVKIVSPTTVPLRQMHQILGESSKIVRYMSDTEPLNRYIHRVVQLYLVNKEQLYIFSHNLYRHQSLQHIVSTQLAATGPLVGGTSAPELQSQAQQLTLANVAKWAEQLSQTVVWLCTHGLSHRYIRPEFVFITADEGDVRLSHFDQACFVWNARTGLVVPRRRAIQDERSDQWTHLPPECFDAQYNGRAVDQWSVAVLVCFALTGQWPFEVPLTDASAQTQWRRFKDSSVARDSGLTRLTPLLALFDTVFVAADQRLSAPALLDRFRDKHCWRAMFGRESETGGEERSRKGAVNTKANKSAEMLTRLLRSQERGSLDRATSGGGKSKQANKSNRPKHNASSNSTSKSLCNARGKSRSLPKLNPKTRPRVSKAKNKGSSDNLRTK